MKKLNQKKDELLAKNNKKITFDLIDNKNNIPNTNVKTEFKIYMQEEKFNGVLISSKGSSQETIIAVIMHYFFYADEIKNYFLKETFSDFDNLLLKEIKKFLEKYLQHSEKLKDEIDESDMSQYTENSRMNTITHQNKEDDSEFVDEEDISNLKLIIDPKSNMKREALKISDIVEALEQLKSKENFEVLNKIKTPAVFLQLVLDLIHCAKNEIRFDYEKLNKQVYKCEIPCLSHFEFFAETRERIECRCRAASPDFNYKFNNYMSVLKVDEVLHYAQSKTKINLSNKMFDFFKEINLNYKNSSTGCPRSGLSCTNNSLKCKIILKNKPKNLIFELEWKDKHPKYSEIQKTLVMLPIIFKNSDYFDLDDRNNSAYYDFISFIAFTGEKYVLIQRVFESNSSYWVCFKENEDPKRFISLKALYGKCLSAYMYPVLLFYRLSNQTSKIINDVNLIIQDEIKINLENFCVEKDKELIEMKKKEKKKEQLKGWRRLIEGDILGKYAENIFKKKEDTLHRIFNKKSNIKKAKTSANNNTLMEMIKKKYIPGSTNRGWKCSFRYCNYINPEDVYTCKNCSTINPLIKEQIHKKKTNKNNQEIKGTLKFKKCISNPIYYEITSTEKFKKKFIKNKLLKNFGSLLFKSGVKNSNDKEAKKLEININEVCVVREKEEELRKKFVLQKVKNVKNIITSLSEIKKLSNNKENYNNNNNSTNLSSIIDDNSIAAKDFKNTNTVSNITMLNKAEQKETNKKQRNYGRKQTKKDFNQNASKPLTDLPNKPAIESVNGQIEENDEDFNTKKLLSDLAINSNTSFENKKTINTHTYSNKNENKNELLKKEENVNSILTSSILNNTSNDSESHHQKIHELKNPDLKITNVVLKHPENPDHQLPNLHSTIFKFSLDKNKNENFDFFDDNAFVVELNCTFCFTKQFCTSMGVCKKCFYIKDDITEDYLNAVKLELDGKGSVFKTKQELIRFNKFNADITGIGAENNIFNKYDKFDKLIEEKQYEQKKNFANNMDNYKVDNLRSNLNNEENGLGNEKESGFTENLKKLKNEFISHNDYSHRGVKNNEGLQHKGFLAKTDNLNSNTIIGIGNKIKNDHLFFNNIKAVKYNQNPTKTKELNLGSGFIRDSLSKIEQNSLLKNKLKNNPFELKVVKIKLDGLNVKNLSLVRDKHSRSTEHLMMNSLNSSLCSNNLNKPIKIIKAEIGKENPARSSNREIKFTIKNEFKIPSAYNNINQKAFVTKNVEIKGNAEKENVENKIVVPKIPTIKRNSTRNNKVMNKNTNNKN